MVGRALIAGLATVMAMVLGAMPASATFVLETSFKGEQKLFIDGENKNVDLFSGEVGAQKSGFFVVVNTIGKVDTGNGFSNIVPVKDGSLTSATFTPADPEHFGDFSLRGQLVKAGTFVFTVQDDQGNLPQTFTFDSGKDDDFSRIGVVSFDGESIKSVNVTGDFKELKQIEFSGIAGAVPEPATWALMLLGFGAMGFAGYRRSRRGLSLA
jgi:hypothetical protein